MKLYLFIASILIISCSKKSESKIELYFTSNNPDTIPEIKSLSLTKLPVLPRAKWETFHNIKAVAVNKFIINVRDTGIFFGLLEIEHRGGIYNINIDSINIKKGINSISSNINLGSVRL